MIVTQDGQSVFIDAREIVAVEPRPRDEARQLDAPGGAVIVLRNGRTTATNEPVDDVILKLEVSWGWT